MSKESKAKSVLAVFFVILLFVGFFKSGSYYEFGTLSKYLLQDYKNIKENELIKIEDIEQEFTSGMWKQNELIDLNGMIAKFLNIQGFYGEQGVYITRDGVTVSASPLTSTDYEYNETVSLFQFLKENGVNLLYVNKPTKYVDDKLLLDEFGVETYSNQNMDRFLDRIRAVGVPTIDLREAMVEDGNGILDLFYKTDHHWTVEAGLWAATHISKGLNEYCGYDIDTTIFDEANYDIVVWENCWLGEQGRLVSGTYVGLDDYIKIKPLFATNYSFKTPSGNYEGTFDNFINESLFDFEKDVNEAVSWHYAYQQRDCINNNVDYGKVLVLGDSYDHAMMPFLSLGIKETDFFALRDKDDSFKLREYILENKYDTIIICYAQFMLGAHDDPTSANYRMYTFQ